MSVFILFIPIVPNCTLHWCQLESLMSISIPGKWDHDRMSIFKKKNSVCVGCLPPSQSAMNAPDSDVNQCPGHRARARGQRLLDTDTSSVTSAPSCVLSQEPASTGMWHNVTSGGVSLRNSLAVTSNKYGPTHPDIYWNNDLIMEVF